MKRSISGQDATVRWSFSPRTPEKLRSFCHRAVVAFAFVGSVSFPFSPNSPARAQVAGSGQKAAGILSAQEVESTFPPSVFFKGKSAPVQWRNASAVRVADNALLFAGLIDTGGYASSVQETYQMYLLFERGMRFGGKFLPAGAYGAGFVGERFIVMDIGGHTVAEGETTLDAGMTRPRPLQFLQSNASGARLYLGRRWVSILIASPGDK